MLYHQWIGLDKLYKLMESFFFQIIGWKPKNIQTNSEAWILIFQWVMYQCIRLDELYKLMESLFYFSIQNQFSN